MRTKASIPALTRSALRGWAVKELVSALVLLSSSLIPGLTDPAPTLLNAITPLTVMGSDGVSGGNGSYAPSFTADSKHILFLSSANNLVANDNREPWMDVFRQTIDSGETVLASINQEGTGGGNGNSSSPSGSGDGRWVAFVSDATDLTADPIPNRVPQVYVRDLLKGLTQLVSRNLNGEGGNAPSRKPQVSENGRFVLFESEASDLVEGDANKATDVFIHDLQEHRTLAITLRADGTATANGPSQSARMSADGQTVVFQSAATDLVTEPAISKASSQVYVWDLSQRLTQRMSLPPVPDLPEFSPLLGAAVEPQLSQSGRYIAYQVVSKKGYALAVALHDRQQPNRFWLHRWKPLDVLFTRSQLQISEPEVSVLCEVSIPFFPLRPQDQLTLRLYPTDQGSCPSSGLGSPVERLVDSQPLPAESALDLLCLRPEPLAEIQDGSIVRNSFRARMSEDGLTIASAVSLGLGNGGYFSSSQLSSYPTNGGLEPLEGVLVRRSLTQAPSAAPIFASIDSQALSPDGQWLAFDSPASYIVPEDANDASDVFLLRIGTSQPQLASRRAVDRPAHLAQPIRRLVLEDLLEPNLSRGESGATPRVNPRSRWVSGDGLRLISLMQSHAGPSALPQPYSDLFAQDQYPKRMLPLTSYAVPTGVSDHAANLKPVSNLVSQVNLDRSGRYLTAILQTSTDQRPPNIESKTQLWSYDLETATRTLLYESTEVDPWFPGQNIWHAGFSSDRDNRMIVFSTASGRLVPEDFDATADLFLTFRDEPSKKIRLTAPALPNQPSLRGESFNPFLSPDGTWIAYCSLAADLTPQPSKTNVKRLWLQNIGSGQRFIILEPLSALAPEILELVWSEDSSFFVVRSADGVCRSVNASDQSVQNLSTDLERVRLSADGHYLVGQTTPTAFLQRSQIIRLDLTTRERRMASVARDGMSAGNGYSQYPQVSANGDWVYFSSEASNLVSDDNNGRPDVFAHSFASGQTILLSRSALSGRPGNGASSRPLLSAEGNALFFQSSASDLITDDFDGREGVFQIRLDTADFDEDGLPDEWEHHYFDDLSVANATTDSDGDGILDVAELDLGLNPTTSGSQARITPLAFDAAQGFLFSWTAGPWGGYVIQYADSLVNPAWRTWGETLPLFITSGTGVDSQAPTHSARYYRIQRDTTPLRW